MQNLEIQNLMCTQADVHERYNFFKSMTTVVVFKNCEADGLSRRHHGILG